MPRIVARLTIQAAVFAALLLAIGTPAAPAGTMRLYSCQTPSGRTVGTAGWTHSPVITRTEAFNDCAAGPNGTLYAEARGPHPLSRRELGVTWRLDAPPSTSITGFATRLCAKSVAPGGLVSVGWNPRFPLSIYDSLQLMTGDFGVEFNALTCVGGPPYRADVGNEVQQSGIATSRLSITAACVPVCEFEGLRATVDVSSVRVDIVDGVAPVVRTVRGPLAANTSHSGVEDVIFDVTDAGVGILRVAAEVKDHATGEWREMASEPIGAQRRSCVRLNETEYPYEFASPQPCPLSLAGAKLSVDTRRLADATHEFRVVVIDAAGNRTAVVPPRRFHSRQPTATPALGLPQPTLQITEPRQRSLGAARAFTIRGRFLDPSGAPLGGVPLTIRARPYLPKPRVATGDWSVLGTVKTAADGSYSARLPGGASRSIQVAAQGGATFAPAAAQVDVIAPARVTARARKARVRNGRKVFISGRVKGPVPPGGVLVALEVREPDRWIPVATTRRWVRTRPSGTFALSYRFLRTFRAATYRFRVIADEDSAFTYSRGASRAIDVRVIP